MPGYNSNNRSNNKGNSYGGNCYGSNQRPQLETLPFTQLTKDNYVQMADDVITHIMADRRNLLTTSQIRNLLSLNSEIYNSVVSSRCTILGENIVSKLMYLKVRMVYESGRQKPVDIFIKNSHLIEHLDDIGTDKEKYMLFARYMEALVAYRKFKGGQDD